MRKLALEIDMEDEGELAGRKSSRKPTAKTKGVQEVSWKEPVATMDHDYYSSNEDDDECWPGVQLPQASQLGRGARASYGYLQGAK